MSIVLLVVPPLLVSTSNAAEPADEPRLVGTSSGEGDEVRYTGEVKFKLNGGRRMQHERDGGWSWLLSSSVVGEETLVPSQRHKLTVCVPQLLSNLLTKKKGE